MLTFQKKIVFRLEEYLLRGDGTDLLSVLIYEEPPFGEHIS